MQRPVLVALALLAACGDHPVAPTPATLPQAAAAAAQQGPPRGYHFGPDTYRVGLFTGQGVTEPGLTCTTSGTTRECTGFLASAVDSARLDVTLEIPASSTPVPLVVIVHGYGGSKSSSGNMARPLLDEGYAVLRYSTRGFGESWGQVNLADLHAEIADLRSMVAQVVDVPDYGLNPDAVAVTGASYGGGHSWLALVTPTFTTPAGNVVRIRTVVPIAAWSDLVYALIPNGRERESIDHPGGVKLSFVNGLFLSGIRRSADRPYPNYPDYFLLWNAWLNAEEPNDADPVFGSIVDGLAGYRSIWWQREFWRQIRSSPVPVFVVQGFTDDLFPFPEAKRMILALQDVDAGYPVAAYLGDIGHPRASNKTGEVDYVTGLIKSWLAYYLKGQGAPPNGVYAALTRPRDEPFDPANVLVVPTLADLSTRTASKAFDALPAVLVNPVTDPLAGFFWDPLVMEGARELTFIPGYVPPPSAVVPGSLATYDVPVEELSGGGDLVIAGQPAITFHAFTPAYRVQLDTRVFDVDALGNKQLITRGTTTLESPVPAVPLGDVDVTILTYGNYWRAPAGHTIRVELTNVDSPYITPSRIPSVTTVTGVRLTVPAR